MKTLEIYTGEYLPFFNTEEWVIARQVRLNKTYETLFQQIFVQLTEQEEYQQAYDIAAKASSLYPFNEYQTCMIESLLSMHSYEKAFQLYTDTAELYFSEMGLEPSPRMRALLDRMNQPIQYSGIAAERVRDILTEENSDGAFYCSLPSFIDNYRFVSRLIERTGQSAYILLTVLEDAHQIPLAADGEKAKEAYAILKRALQSVLRKGDVFTSYNSCTFLSLLMCTNDKGCQTATKRILEKFKELNIHTRTRLSFRSFPVSFAEQTFARLSALHGNQELCVCIDRNDSLRIEGRVYNRFTEKPIIFTNITDFFLKLNLLYDRIGFPQSDRKIKSFRDDGESASISQPVRTPEYSAEQIMEHQGELLTFCLKVSQRRHLSWQGVMEVNDAGPVIPFNSELQLAYEMFRLSDGKEKRDAW